MYISIYLIDKWSGDTLFVYNVCRVHKYGNIILFHTRKFPEGGIFYRKCMSRRVKGLEICGASIWNARQDFKPSTTLCVSYCSFFWITPLFSSAFGRGTGGGTRGCYISLWINDCLIRVELENSRFIMVSLFEVKVGNKRSLLWREHLFIHFCV